MYGVLGWRGLRRSAEVKGKVEHARVKYTLQDGATAINHQHTLSTVFGKRSLCMIWRYREAYF